jgi:3-deoxy-D-manno-octulosonic acid kinase
MKPTLLCKDSDSFLYDAESSFNIHSRWFELNFHRQQGRMTAIAQGRGQTCFFSYQDDRYVLRHYRRGGSMASWLDDRYLWTGLERTRAFREWQLLAKLRERRLPVPDPVAARVVRWGVFYRADLVTREIQNSRTLATHLMRLPLSFEQWRKIGRNIRGFHEAGVFHADLNAHNILIDSLGKVFLIDFDKGAIRKSSTRWKQSNLMRLHRSLLKLKRLHPEFKFDDNAFQQLHAAYRNGC